MTTSQTPPEYFEWNEKYSVGVDEIDDYHKKILEQINQLLHALLKDKPMVDMGNILMGLISYTRYHFRQEEELMAAHHYPDYQAHRLHHDQLFERVLAFTNDFFNRKLEPVEITTFLMEWWMNHILEEDMRYKAYLHD